MRRGRSKIIILPRGKKERWLIAVLTIYSLLHLLALQGVHIMNFTHSTSINIKVSQDKAAQEEKWRNLYFYDHPVLRRIDGSGTFYLTAVMDDSERLIDTKPVKTGQRNKFFSQNAEASEAGQVKTELSEIDNPKEQSDDARNIIDDYPELEYFELYDKEINPEETDELGNASLGEDTDAMDVEDSVEENKEDNKTTVKSVNGLITLNGWDWYKNHKSEYRCCYQYNDNKRKIASMLMKTIWDLTKLKILNAAQFVCPLVLKDDSKVANEDNTPTHVALTITKSCKDSQGRKIKFMKVERKRKPPQHSNTIAICAKIIYDHYPADRLIEWFEFNKLMGVDKIMMYRYNISKNAQKVLDYYEINGFLETIEYDYPLKKTYTRKPGGKNVFSYHDEQVTVYDCLERYREYDFVTVLDIDEFLVPVSSAPDGNWKTLLNNLLAETPNSAGFSLHTQIFTLDWGKSNPNGKMFISQYIKRTSAMWDRKKNIVMPKRVQMASVWTHDFNTVAPYARQKISAPNAVIFHYRKCRQSWVLSKTCMSNRKKITDKTMLKIAWKLEGKVKQLKKSLLGT